MRKKERPPHESCTHIAEDRAPDVRLNKVPVVLIETFAGAAIVAHDFECLTYLKVVVERSFVLVLEGSENFRIVLV